MKVTKTALLTLASSLLVASLANAGNLDSDRSEITQKVSPLLHDLPIEKVLPSGRAGLYEIMTPQGIFYTDKSGSFVIFGGTMVDTKTKVNLTEQRLNELINFKFSELPLKDAVKTVRGNGSRVLVTFEDPNCGFCKKLMQEVNKIDNLTVYTFLIPILSPDSGTKAKAIWCSPDPSNVWVDFMSKNVALPTQSSSTCEVPFERNLALQSKLHVTGTPSLFFKDNSKIAGYVKAEEIEAKLK
jgi:thiol:disulfide interchange protein DsbC